MKKVFLGMALAISVSMAEKSGAFLGGGFQYSNLENQNTTRTPGANNNTPIDTSMFGSNQTAPVAQAQATYTPSVMNTNNYGQMYGVVRWQGISGSLVKPNALALGLMDTTAITMRI
ncbi:hypothetical protein HpBT153_04140 [Helicobacter pylori]